ncbi:MAG: phospholipase [Chloroflexi bacterium]|nr:phospholipase [Chloroflexota bacterium]
MVRLPMKPGRSSRIIGSLPVIALALAAVLWRVAFPDALPAPIATPAQSLPGYQAATPGDGVLRGAWYELAFTQPTAAANPEESAVERLLIEMVDRSQQTLDVAIHDLDLERVTESFARAAQRGVRVRMVAESTIVGSTDRRTQLQVQRLRDADIPIVVDGASHTMHHKFVVADGRWVQTGSWNYTFSETYRNNNNAIVIESRELAANFTSEFEKMFLQGRFGSAKPRGVPYPVLGLAGARVENYFSPADRSASHVIRWLGAAQQRVRFLAFSFTHDGIGDAILERARSGVAVGGVFEASATRDQYSEYARLKSAGLDVLLDTNPFNLHHKVMVLDGRVTIFGSFNFSASADRENDENLLIVEDPGLAAAFEAEYERIRAQALGRNGRP